MTSLHVCKKSFDALLSLPHSCPSPFLHQSHEWQHILLCPLVKGSSDSLARMGGWTK